MINKLSINNFQSHKNTEIELNEGVNVFVGPSDSGKTAIIRAIRWLLENRPLGDEFKSHWGGTVSVSVNIDNAFILRQKGKSINRYVVDDEEFKAMGTIVPDEISKLFNMSSINTQFQLDPPFLLASSSGEVAEFFNKLVNLNDIEISQKNISSQLRKVNWQIVLAKEQLEAKQNDLQSFNYINTAEETLNTLNAITEQITKSQGTYISLEETLNLIYELNLSISEKTKLISYDNLIATAINKLFYIKNKKEEIELLNTTINKILLSENVIKESEKLMAHEEQINSLKMLESEIKNKSELLIELGKALSAFNETQKKINSIQERLTTAEKEFNKLMPDICPLCGQIVNKLITLKNKNE